MSCDGSGPFRFCVRYQTGPYNVTGNETCSFEKNVLQCQMQFRHYFHEPTNYTLVVIMANDVSKLVIPIGINIYKGYHYLYEYHIIFNFKINNYKLHF